MILFNKDWDLYPTAIVDTLSTNSTWVRLASVLKLMGIKNYKFLLALYQPELQGIDPYSPDLTNDQKLKISTECQYNPWYFWREVARVPNGNNPLQFKLNRGTLALMWCFLCHIDFALIMPRQQGKSVCADLIMVWLLCFGVKGTELFLFTKDIPLRKRNIKRVKASMALLPTYLNPTCRGDLDNTEVVTAVANRNLLKCAVGQEQTDRALKVGRGDTLQIVQVDEVPYIANIKTSLPVVLSAGSTIRNIAREEGNPYGNIFTTTAGELDTEGGKYFHDMISSGMYWNEILYDTTDKQEVRLTVLANCSTKRCIINGTFSHRQIGVSDAELLDMIAIAGGTEDEINRDYYNVWTNGSSRSPLSIKLNTIIESSVLEIAHVEVTSQRYIINWYVDGDRIYGIMSQSHHVLGLDSGNAVGRDNNAIVITDIRDMSVTATAVVSEASLHVYAIWVADLLIMYPRTTLIIENRSSGQAIIDTIAARLYAAGIDPFKRMYSTIVDGYMEKPIQFKEVSRHMDSNNEEMFIKYKKHIGFMTTGESRAFLYDTVLMSAASTTGHLIRDRGLVDEIKGLVLKNGRVDHSADNHDDRVIAWLLTHWFVKYSKNLSYYGIDTSESLSLVSTDGAMLTEGELANRRRLKLVQAEIDSLKAELVSGVTIIETRRLERTLAVKVGVAQTLGDATISLDSIMEEMRQSKAPRRNLANAVRGLRMRTLR